MLKKCGIMVDSNRDAVFQKFKNRCIICQQLATDLHEIVPRSQTRDWNREENQVPLCKKHHTWVHDNGAMKVKDFLLEKRNERLIAYHNVDRSES